MTMELVDKVFAHPALVALSLSPDQQRLLRAWRRYAETGSTAALQTVLDLFNSEP